MKHRLIRMLCLVPLVFSGIGLAGEGASEEPPPAEKLSCQKAFEAQRSSLSLDYVAFDQTPRQGWRTLAQESCFKEAAELIQRYLDTRSDLPAGDKRNLSFHAGQLLAVENDYAAAIPYFERALKKEEREDASFKWNAYVNATIAFLKKDRPALEAHRAEVARGAARGGKIPNLDVVDALLRNFDKSYREAYNER